MSCCFRLAFVERHDTGTIRHSSGSVLWKFHISISLCKREICRCEHHEHMWRCEGIAPLILNLYLTNRWSALRHVD